MQTTAIVQAIDSSSGTPLATVQLVGLGNIETFYDGYSISDTINTNVMVQGALVIVEINDPNHPGDGQIVAMGPGTTDTSGPTDPAQSGAAIIALDGAGNGAVTVTYPTPYSITPTITAGTKTTGVGGGTITVSTITTTTFHLAVAGGTPNVDAYVSWAAQAAITEKLAFYGETPIAQRTSTNGNVTAGATYTAQERAMLTDAYTALRALGLLN